MAKPVIVIDVKQLTTETNRGCLDFHALHIQSKIYGLSVGSYLGKYESGYVHYYVFYRQTVISTSSDEPKALLVKITTERSVLVSIMSTES